MRFVCSLALLAALATTHCWAADPLLWIEGEQPTDSKDLVANAGLNTINPFALSGGAWLSSFSEKDMPNTGWVSYTVDLPNAGAWQLWLRAAPGTGLALQVDGGEWTLLDTKKALDPRPSSANGNMGWPSPVAWYAVTPMDLPAGKHTFAFMLGGLKQEGGRFAAIDCLVLTTGAFVPNGKYQPGAVVPPVVQELPAEQGWTFTPAKDTLEPAALLDLRALNETTAGEHGFIRRSADGNSFVRGDGQPIRFWGASEYAQRDLDLAALKVHAQFLAKRGVNVVRVHSVVAPKGPDSQVTDVDEKEVDQIQKLVAAMKTAGIYTVISPYWGTPTHIQKNWGALADVGAGAEPMLFVDPALQKGYRAWVKAIYDRPNPYDDQHLRLADDPAVAIIQLQNENSLLFWSLGNFKNDKNGSLTFLRQRYAEFLVAKYGSLDKARAAWQDYNPGPGEIWYAPEWDKGLPTLVHPWDFTRDAMAKKGKWPGFLACSSDELEFLCTAMRRFNSETAEYFHKELGCKQLINAGNWRGVDSVLTQDAEYWSYTANEVMGKNIYCGGLHVGINDGWQILPGHFYSNVSMIREPVQLPVNIKQPQGYPFIIPETLWVPPNLYQAEGPLMVAAQTALTGLDITFWFCSGDAEWNLKPISQGKWAYNTPMLLGQFPAAALIFRQALVAEGQPVVVEQRTQANIFARATPIVSEESGWDPNRDREGIPVTSSVKGTTDPLVHLVGPVRVVLGGDPAKTTALDLAPYIDRSKKVVRSITGEIETHYGDGIYLVNAPMAQAAAGFLGAAGPQQLRDVTITCTNRYAAIVVVALDHQPLKDSGKVLVQIGTISRPTGWAVQADQLFPNKAPADCLRVVNPGNPPWLVEKAVGTVSIANTKLTKATVLDANGIATAQPVGLQAAAGRMVLELPPAALYVVLSAP